MAKNKSSAMSFVIAALALAFEWYVMFEVFDLDRGVTEGVIVAVIGFATAYFAIKMSTFDPIVNKGLLWAGGITVFASAWFITADLGENVIPFVLFGLLAGAIFFVSKFKKQLL